ncbi:MAG: hypothetical protein U0800_26425 [Isosphaeraceae bacterium]
MDTSNLGERPYGRYAAKGLTRRPWGASYSKSFRTPGRAQLQPSGKVGAKPHSSRKYSLRRPAAAFVLRLARTRPARSALACLCFSVAAVAGPQAAQIAADLLGAERDALPGEFLAHLPATPGPLLPQQFADGLGMVAEVAGDLRRRPPGVGERHHLDAIAHLVRQVVATQGFQFITGGFIEVDADHAEL